MSSCSVVMVAYQTGPVLFAAVKAVLKQKQLAECIVVDNGNPPAAFARLQQIALTEPRLIIISGHGNIGYARGCNLGAAKATGDYLLLLKHDCLLPPDALVEMMAGLGQSDGAMLAGCSLENPDGTIHFNDKKQLLEPKDVFLGGLRLRKPLPPAQETHEVPAIASAFIGIKRADYEHLQGMDEGFFLYGENIDLCKRVHMAGGKVICIPGIKVTHMPVAHETSLLLREWQQAKGFRLYFNKHFRKKYLPGVLTLVYLMILIRFAFKVTVGTLENRFLRRPMLENLATKRLMILASGLADLPESQEMQGKAVLVTGATGQVGLCVIRRLLAAGASVIALSRGEAIPFRHEQLRWLKGDLSGPAFNLGDYHTDAVVHCAPLWLLPTAALVQSGTQRIIVFSTTSVFAKALSKNEYEKDLVRRVSHKEEELAEHCRTGGIALTILRPTLIYGVGLDGNVTALSKFIRRFGFFPVYPPAFGRRQPVHADDLAIATLQAMDNKKSFGRAYNVSGGEIITYCAMLERLFKLFALKPNIVKTTMLPFIFDVAGKLLRKKHINGEIARRMNDDLIFFHDEATKDFGFSPRPFLSGGIRDIEGF